MGKELREWQADGKVAGKTRSAQNLTFATIKAAGHMVRLLVFEDDRSWVC